jgi:hypothetical protein
LWRRVAAAWRLLLVGIRLPLHLRALRSLTAAAAGRALLRLRGLLRLLATAAAGRALLRPAGVRLLTLLLLTLLLLTLLLLALLLRTRLLR